MTGLAYVPTEEQWQAALIIANEGSAKKAADTIGVPYREVLGWRHQNWWKELEVRARETIEDRFIVEADKLVRKGLEGLNKRFEEGDPYTVNGKVKYRPLNTKALVITTGVLFDKIEKVLARRRPEPEKVVVVQPDPVPQLPLDQKQALGNLADEFLRIANAKRIPHDSTGAVVIEGERAEGKEDSAEDARSSD